LPVYNVTQISYRQSLIVARLQGRMNAIVRAVSSGMFSFGAILGGMSGTLLGLNQTMFVGGIVATGSALCALSITVTSFAS
jgi:hypothetical protein